MYGVIFGFESVRNMDAKPTNVFSEPTFETE